MHLIMICRMFGIRERYALRRCALAWEGERDVTADKYACGYMRPRYPIPVTEIDNALAMPVDRVTFWVKRHVIWLLNK